ncbi:MAG: hypothetical protein ACP5FZ_06080 [Fidelibacterota bacterium]
MPDPRIRSRLNRRTDRDAEAQEQDRRNDIDFSEPDKRRDYLKQRLDDILDNIGQSYGKRMAEELMKRLQKTVLDFNAEVNQMLDKLEVIEEERRKEAEAEKVSAEQPVDTKAGEGGEGETEPSEDEFANMSDFEKRIEMLERKKKQNNDEIKKAAEEAEKKPQKKGLFRRKNK